MLPRAVPAAVAAAALLAAGALGAGATATTAKASKPPQLKHIFVIVFENKNYADIFTAKPEAPYLVKKLTARGEQLKNYYGIGHDSLANYIALVSGQGPNPQTQSDCQSYTDFLPGLPSSSGQYLGSGCVFPPGVESVANQLDGNGYLWKAYQQAMEKHTAGDHGTPGDCRHPSANASDGGIGGFTDGYVTKHNPFMYFHSTIDFPKTCKKHDVDLSQFHKDLRREATTPNYSFITPTMCNDGHNEPCKSGKRGGLPQIDRFLHHHVPKIMRSRAYQDRGLLMIIFDEAHSPDDCISHPCPTGTDATACCGEVTGPNTPNNGGLATGLGGGRTGAVLLSPCIRPGTVNKTPYNHYSMLRSVEDSFGLPHLGYADTQGLKPLGSKALNRPSCGEQMHLHASPGHAPARARTGFHFKVKAPLRRCRVGVRVRFAHQRVRTGHRGVAIVHAKLHGAGSHYAAARKHGCRDARTVVTASAA